MSSPGFSFDDDDIVISDIVAFDDPPVNTRIGTQLERRHRLFYYSNIHSIIDSPSSSSTNSSPRSSVTQGVIYCKLKYGNRLVFKVTKNDIDLLPPNSTIDSYVELLNNTLDRWRSDKRGKFFETLHGIDNKEVENKEEFDKIMKEIGYPYYSDEYLTDHFDIMPLFKRLVCFGAILINSTALMEKFEVLF